MQKRSSIAASIVSVLIFSSIVLSNFLIIQAYREKLRFSEYTYSENELIQNMKMLSESQAYNLLYYYEVFFSTTNIACNESPTLLIPSYTSELKNNNSYLFVKMSITQEKNNTQIRSLSPFSGTTSEGLNFEASYRFRGEALNNLIFLKRSGSYYLHLDFKIYEAQKICVSALSALEEAVYSWSSSCNPSLLSLVISDVSSEIGIKAFLSGFLSSVSYEFIPGGKCGLVKISVSIVQTYITGPVGYFSGSVSQSETIDLTS